MAVKKHLRLPMKVKVGGKEIPIIVHWGDLDEAGYWDDTKFEIHVDLIDGDGEAYDEFHILHTFVHELFHAIDTIYCNDKIFLTKKGKDHPMMNQFTHGLLQVMLDSNFINKVKFWKKEKTCSEKCDPTAS